MVPTKPNRSLAYKDSGFDTLADALDYAAQGETGYNFYDDRGELRAVASYCELRAQARELASRLNTLDCPRGARVAIIGETGPMFVRFFFACQYAGLVPVALPADVPMGGHDAYVSQLQRLLQACSASIAVAPESHAGFLNEAAKPFDIIAGTAAAFDALEIDARPIEPLGSDETAYLQYTSGSTQFPRGVEVTQASVMNNLMEIARYGLKLSAADRMMSWLPLFHDMGLVGFLLLPLATQLSVDLMSPRTFAMRPRLWLKILSENGGTVTSSPPFGYSLCAKRLRAADAEKYDLSKLRAACVGAERINPEPLAKFAEVLAPSGFRPEAFLPCYGMAECALAISFAPLDEPMNIDVVDKQAMSDNLHAQAVDTDPAQGTQTLSLVDCGALLPSYELSIRDESGVELDERHCGRILVRGPSVMCGYFENSEATKAVLAEDGWFDTGDIGYRIGNHLVVTARHKDVIIINGRNMWPQDLEVLADQVHNRRIRNVSAFSAATHDGDETPVMVVETRDQDPANCRALVKELQGLVKLHFGVNAYIDVVEPGTLPRTSSGKLSRIRTKRDFLQRSADFCADPTMWKPREAHG
ncbi:MAG: fatty acyl-AMP ligase [Gammaproteobacteria bacterium]|nr:fatty acyl-AMP ligase [Gammaproteobacteria bacterium]